MNPVRAAVNPGLRYGALAFLIGAVLGPLRELVLAPLLGPLAAAVIEALLLAPAIYWVARGSIKLLGDVTGREPIVALVLCGLVVLLLAEAFLAGLLKKTGLATPAAPGEVERWIGYALIGWFLIAPFLARRQV